MSDEDFTYNGKAVGTSCDGIGECGTGLVYCLNQNTTQCSTNPGSPDDESQPEVCDNKDNDCDASVDEGIAPQACGGGLCAGSKNCSTGGMWGACSTVYKDGGTCAICNYEGAPVYDGTQDEDCAGYSYDPIGTCLNNPDNSPFTWDSCLGFTSECFDIDTCTQQPKSFTHECSKSGCGAECASDGDCANGYCKGPVGGCGCRLNGDVVAVPPLSRVVNIYDLAAIGISFNTHPGDMNWNAEADVHPRGGDGKVGIFDLAFVGMNYGHSY